MGSSDRLTQSFLKALSPRPAGFRRVTFVSAKVTKTMAPDQQAFGFPRFLCFGLTLRNSLNSR